ncbi:YqzE family protein [Paenibacillus gansuensis]|uniref:YqzE family protein n=1 Tax=Paenibacillus gansuensis TaxID=306542 RepID=A0ABW5PF93_9BACL
MAKGEDLIKYITQQVVTYMETPKEIRRQSRQEAVKEPWSTRWFGMIPMSLEMLFQKNRRSKKDT